MPYDPALAERLARVIGVRPDMEEKKMFGGVGWMLNGNMCVGIYKEFLVIRIGIEAAGDILAEDNVKEMDITGKVMKGWAMVNPDGIEKDEDLHRFVGLSIDFVGTLPVK